MKKYYIISFIVLALVFSYSLKSYAKGQTSIQNTSSAGVVIATVMCATANPNPWVHRSQIAFDADGCDCVLNNYDPFRCNDEGTADEPDEGNDDYCTECLASLISKGLVIVPSAGFFDPRNEEYEMMYFYLQGNANAFISAIGGSCPCP